MHVSFFCYFHLPGSKLALDALSCSSMDTNFGEPTQGDTKHFDAYVQDLVDVLGAEAIFKRLKRDINNPKLPYFKDILSAISISSQFLPQSEVRPFYRRLNLPRAIREACERETHTGDRNLHCTVWFIGLDHLQYVVALVKEDVR